MGMRISQCIKSFRSRLGNAVTRSPRRAGRGQERKQIVSCDRPARCRLIDVRVIEDCPELVVLTVVQMVPLRFELTYLQQCMATWSETSELTWHIIKLLFIYTIPLFFMTVAYYQIVKVLWRSNNVPGQAETMKLAPAEQSALFYCKSCLH
ncbi:hypothetical protein EVAR_65039_1 [Eumeta japonica]|uniref:Uncharacterized protein n=1 Tax=Eumeta variegata TaxID=151549 RepID=A0A4C1YQ83_EUMVA|nr:hypothetical protein EVAR_65039_1 [Eumeta japonica]